MDICGLLWINCMLLMHNPISLRKPRSQRFTCKRLKCDLQNWLYWLRRMLLCSYPWRGWWCLSSFVWNSGWNINVSWNRHMRSISRQWWPSYFSWHQQWKTGLLYAGRCRIENYKYFFHWWCRYHHHMPVWLRITSTRPSTFGAIKYSLLFDRWIMRSYNMWLITQSLFLTWIGQFIISYQS